MPLIPLDKLVHWDFQIVEQNFVTRWGSSGGKRYKQYQPAGLTLNDKYPPKPVDERTYQMARRQLARVKIELSRL